MSSNLIGRREYQCILFNNYDSFTCQLNLPLWNLKVKTIQKRLEILKTWRNEENIPTCFPLSPTSFHYSPKNHTPFYSFLHSFSICSFFRLLLSNEKIGQWKRNFFKLIEIDDIIFKKAQILFTLYHIIAHFMNSKLKFLVFKRKGLHLTEESKIIKNNNSIEAIQLVNNVDWKYKVRTNVPFSWLPLVLGWKLSVRLRNSDQASTHSSSRQHWQSKGTALDMIQ